MIYTVTLTVKNDTYEKSMTYSFTNEDKVSSGPNVWTISQTQMIARDAPASVPGNESYLYLSAIAYIETEEGAKNYFEVPSSTAGETIVVYESSDGDDFYVIIEGSKYDITVVNSTEHHLLYKGKVYTMQKDDGGKTKVTSVSFPYAEDGLGARIAKIEGSIEDYLYFGETN